MASKTKKKSKAPAAKKKTTSAGAGLLDKIIAPVWESPDDDGLRAVVGDALLEAGSPWGELVALQLKIAAKKATPADRKLAATLVKRHRDIIGGAIAKVGSTTKDWICEKGFLFKCALERRLVKRPDWEAAAKSPYWATVRSVRISILVTSLWWMTEWAKNPALRNLRLLNISHLLILERENETQAWRVTKSTGGKTFGKYLAAFAAGLPAAEQKRIEITSHVQPRQREMLEAAMTKAGVTRASSS